MTKTLRVQFIGSIKLHQAIKTIDKSSFNWPRPGLICSNHQLPSCSWSVIVVFQAVCDISSINMVPCRHLAVVVLLLVNLESDCPINTKINNQQIKLLCQIIPLSVQSGPLITNCRTYLTCHTLSTVKVPVGANKLFKKKCNKGV